MTMRRLRCAAVAASVAAALAGCGARSATAPARAYVTVGLRMVVRSCSGASPRQVPMRATVLVDGRGRHVRITTGQLGNASMPLPPGRYTVSPLRPALLHAVVSVRFDGSAVPASRGEPVVDVTGGRHRILLLVARRPLECNGLGAAG
jgi:hypothetical protein